MYTYKYIFLKFLFKIFRKIIERRDNSKENVAKWQEKKLGVMDIFIILTVSQVFTYVKTPSNTILNMCSESTIFQNKKFNLKTALKSRGIWIYLASVLYFDVTQNTTTWLCLLFIIITSYDSSQRVTKTFYGLYNIFFVFTEHIGHITGQNQCADTASLQPFIYYLCFLNILN